MTVTDTLNAWLLDIDAKLLDASLSSAEESKRLLAIKADLSTSLGLAGGGGGGGGGDVQPIVDKLDEVITYINTLESLSGDIKSNTATVTSALSAINTSTDGLESLLTSIGANTDGVEALLNTLDTRIQSIVTALGYITGQSTLTSDLVEYHQNVTTTATSLTTNGNTHARSVLLKAVKSNGQANTSSIFIGASDTGTRFELYPGDAFTVESPNGRYLDVSQIFVKGSSGDGVAIWRMN